MTNNSFPDELVAQAWGSWNSFVLQQEKQPFKSANIPQVPFLQPCIIQNIMQNGRGFPAVTLTWKSKIKERFEPKEGVKALPFSITALFRTISDFKMP